MTWHSQAFTSMLKSTLNILQGIFIALISCALYFASYRVNEIFDKWTLFAQGINLIFIPAGIKHIAILIAGKWGALGCLIGLIILALEFWGGFPVSAILGYTVISTGSTWIGIVLSLRVMRINKNLNNLKFIHLPLIDLITTTLHGLVTNTYFYVANMKSSNLIENSTAMILGDYTGSFIILTFLFFSLKILEEFKKQRKQENILK